MPGARNSRAARRLWIERNSEPRALSAILKPQDTRSLSIAFYPNWQQDVSFPALERALPQIDWVLPTWLALQGPNLVLNTASDNRTLAYIRQTKPNVAIFPVLQNATQGKWDGAGLAILLADPKRRADVISRIVSYLEARRLQGVTVDFEDVPPEAYRDLRAFLSEMSANFAAHGWIVVLASPFDDDKWPFAAFAKIVDYTLLMAYDEHDDHADAGSIAGQPWYETTLDKRMKVLSPRRTIIGIGNYGYDWNSGHADSLSFEDAVIAAHDSGADIVFDDATNNPHFSYTEEDNTVHDVWFLDAVTAFNEIHAADIYQPAGYALWRLGSEDPSVWAAWGNLMVRAFRQACAAFRPARMSISKARAKSCASRPTRRPACAPRNRQANRRHRRRNLCETADELCDPPVRRGSRQARVDVRRRPDSEWTPEILDILKAKHVPATFFIIGSNAEANPGIVQRILARRTRGRQPHLHASQSRRHAESKPCRSNSTRHSGCFRR